MTNFIPLILSFAGIIGVWLASEGYGFIDDVFVFLHQDGLMDDDDLQSDINFLINNFAWTLYTFFLICIMFAIIGIVGAMRYRPWMVLTCAGWYVLQGIASLVVFGSVSLGVIIAGIWAYPSIMLYQEQLENVMSEENYENEMHSCCCVSRRKITVHEAIENRVGIFS